MVFYSDTFVDMKEAGLIQIVSEAGLLLPFLFKKKNYPLTVINRLNLFWRGYYSFSYKGNLDERVRDRVLYDILIQAGRAGSTSFGALGENFKWGLFIIKY